MIEKAAIFFKTAKDSKQKLVNEKILSYVSTDQDKNMEMKYTLKVMFKTYQCNISKEWVKKMKPRRRFAKLLQSYFSQKFLIKNWRNIKN